MPRRLGRLLRPGLQRVGPFLLCCLLQAVSGQQQAAGSERLLSRSPWKRAGFPSAPAGPQAALSQADRAGGLKETHPDGREPKSGLGWPPRLPLSLPSCGAYPCTPPPHSSSVTPRPSCSRQSSRQPDAGISTAEAVQATQEKPQHLPFLPPPALCRDHTTFQLPPVVYSREGSPAPRSGA